MPILRYLTDWEATQYASVEDKELNELLQVARDINPKLLAQSYSTYVKRRFRKGYYETRYSVLVRTEKSFEVQIINFYSPSGDIHTVVSAEVLAAYLYGLLHGSRCRKEAHP